MPLTHTLRRADEMEKTMIGNVRKETESGSRDTKNSPFGCADPYPIRKELSIVYGRFPLEFCLLPFRAALRCE